MDNRDSIELLESLRDFFHYGRRKHLQQAYEVVIASTGGNIDQQEIDWDMEEYIFNRLFTGPMTPVAPCIASVYLEPEGLIQGKITAEIREFYASIGLSLEETGKEPEDSLAYELDACRHLLVLAKDIPDAREAYNSFMGEHIALWVPEFSLKAIESCPDSVAVKKVLQHLSDWIEGENSKIKPHKEKQ